MSEVERNKTLIRTLMEAVDRGDLDAVAACYSPGYRDNASGGSRGAGDRAGTLATFEELQQAFPDVRHTIHDLIAEGDKVVMRVSAAGMHRGIYAGIPATGRTVEMTQTVVYRLHDGQIVERWCDGAESVLDHLSGNRAPCPVVHRSSVDVLHGEAAAWKRHPSGGRFWEIALADVSLTCFRLDAGASFAAHSHEAQQITMVLEGRLLFDVGDEIHVIGPGDAVAIPSWTVHAVRAGEEPVLAIDAWSPPPEHLEMRDAMLVPAPSGTKRGCRGRGP